MPTAEHCVGCPYRASSPAIGPRGDPASRIVLVGEAPGKKEIDEGQPFVGPAGEVLWEAIAEAGLHEAEVFVVNALACRPPLVRPSPMAIDACRGRLVRDTEAHPHRVIIGLGVTAVRAITERRRFPMMMAHGVELLSPWGPLVPTFHPAFILRLRAVRPMLVEDLKHARRIGSWGQGVTRSR